MRRLATTLMLLLAALGCADLAGIEAGQLRSTSAHGGAGSNGSAAGAASATPGGGLNASGAGGGSSSNGGAPSAGGAHEGSAGTPSSAGTAGTNLGGAANGGGSAGMTSAGSGGVSPCPVDMVEASSSMGDAFCIDALEVTNADYLAFTQAHTPDDTQQPSTCSGNKSFLPAANCVGALDDVPSKKVPVVCVDWCDARAYCASQNKRLCGRIGGAANPVGDMADGSACEWFAACTGLDDQVQSGNQCNGAGFDSNATHPKAASQIPDCDGGFAGIHNLSGNVAEWENSCDSSSAQANCNTRGGSFQDGPYELACVSGNAVARLTQSATIGIRCCADAL